NPVVHWIVLLLPVIFFGLFWLTEGQGAVDPVFRIRTGERESQLLITFLIILWALVAIRSAGQRDWGLGYRARVGVIAVAVGLLVLIGIGRIAGNNSTFIAGTGAERGSQTLSAIVLVVAAVLLVAQSALALRTPRRFEKQFAQAV